MAESALVQVRGVRKQFGPSLRALDGIDLDIYQGELVCLLGPSGCGKSTLLNVIAGFVKPEEGSVLAFGKPVTGPGPERAMVFQEYALFPWMTVAENIAFGLEIQGRAREAIRETVDGLLQKLSLRGFGERFPKELSGGMRQRVAIARALAVDSPMLLMDEPFGALDALTRRSMQDELLRIWADFRKTIVFVTHGIDESVYLADRVVVMTYRPGTVKRIVEIRLPRPRDPAAPEFASVLRELTALVQEEQLRHERDESSAAAI
jgi:NitT/TauT family transport system ATP-binding protein